MSDPMPERVFLRKENGDRGEETLLVSWLPVSGGGCVPYVPESRLLAAEARVRELEQIHRDEMDLHDEMEAKLAAERDALVPLARFGLAALNDNMENYGPSAELDTAASCGVFTRITHNDGGVSWDDTPATTQARAILAREGT